MFALSYTLKQTWLFKVSV